MKKILRPIVLLMVAVLMVTVVGCSTPAVPEVTISKTTAVMTVGDSLILTAKASDSTAIVWSSDKTDIATVTNGTVAAVKAGTAVITAKSDTASAKCTITVNKKEGTLVLDVTAMQLDIGGAKTLVATSTDLEGVTSFVSSTPTVATVSSGGVVTGVAFGTTTITATQDGKSATCVVVVSDVKLSANKLTLDIGNVKQLSITSQYPSTPIGTFISANSALVSTTEAGLLTAVAVGITNVKVKVGEAEAICEVEVIDRSEYKIVSTAADFDAIRQDPAGNYILVNDIDFEDIVLKKVATSTNEFSGIFDGNGYTLSNFRIGEGADGSSSEGLFGYINKKGIIRNINIKSASVMGSYSGLFGDRNRGLIENIYVRNSTITAPKYWSVCLGGIIGKNEGTIKNCILDFMFSAANAAAGPTVSRGIVAGTNNSTGTIGIVENCIVSNDDISAVEIVGVMHTPENPQYVSNYHIPLPGFTKGTVTNCKAVELADFKKTATFAEYNFENFSIIDDKFPEVRTQTKPIILVKNQIAMTDMETRQIVSYTYDGIKPTYTPKDATILTVSVDGLITPLKVGTTEITLSKIIGGKTFSAVVAVEIIESLPVLNMDTTLVLPKTATTQDMDLEILVKGVAFVPDASAITWASTKTDVAEVDEDGVLTVLQQGAFTTISATYKGVTATCLVTIEGQAYVADFSTMTNSEALPTGYTNASNAVDSPKVKAVIKDGFFDISTTVKDTNAVIMLPQGIVGDTDEYYVDFEFSYVSQHVDYRYIGFKYRQNPVTPTKDFFQYAIRSNASSIHDGIMFSRNKNGAANNTIIGSFTEDLVVGKVYTARMYAKGERSTYYMDGIKMTEGTTEGYDVPGKELGIEVSSSNFKIKKITVNYGKPDAGITVSEDPISLDAKKSVRVNANPAYPSQAVLVWSSSDTTIATVAQDGTVTGIAGGKATITVKSGALEKSFEVTVVDPTVKFEELTVKVGIGAENVKQLVLDISFGTGWDVKYESSDETVATISTDGKVTGIKAGTVTITAKVSTKTAVCTVQIIDGQEIEMPEFLELMPNIERGFEAKLFVSTSTIVWTAPENDIMTFAVDTADSKKVTIKGLKIGEVVLTATCDGKTEDIIIKVLPYYMDFAVMADSATLPTGYVPSSSTTMDKVKAEIKDGFLDISTTANGTNAVIMLPKGIVGTADEYYVDFMFSYFSQHSAGRYIGFKYMQNPAAPTTEFFQYAIRSSAKSQADGSGIMFSKNKSGKSDNAIKAAYSENLVVGKLYTARIYVKGDKSICYLNGTKMVEGTTTGYNVPGRELGIEVSSANFKIKQIVVTLGSEPVVNV